MGEAWGFRTAEKRTCCSGGGSSGVIPQSKHPLSLRTSVSGPQACRQLLPAIPDERDSSSNENANPRNGGEQAHRHPATPARDRPASIIPHIHSPLRRTTAASETLHEETPTSTHPATPPKSRRGPQARLHIIPLPAGKGGRGDGGFGCTPCPERPRSCT